MIGISLGVVLSESRFVLSYFIGEFMMVSILDQIFWMRAGLGVVTGVATQVLFGSDYYNGVVLALLVFLISYYLSRFVWGKKLSKEQLPKLYTAGLGTFITLYLFFWLLLFTIGVHSLSLVLS